MTRFVDIDLSRLPHPEVVSTLDFNEVLSTRLSDLTTRLSVSGIDWDVSGIKSDPLVINQEHASYFELLLEARVNDAAKSTMLAFAEQSDLDHKAAEFGVVRQVIVPADLTASPPVTAVMESDASLRRRRQLAVEALSTAGPEGAYLFFALAAHPLVLDAAVYDPHSGLCDPGEVLLVLASRDGAGIPKPSVMDGVADFLDAREVRYADYTHRTRTLTRKQKIRPLTDKVIVEAANDWPFTIDAVLKIPFGPDWNLVRNQAVQRLNAYLETRRKVGLKISGSSIAAALHVTDPSGVALVEDIDLRLTNGDANGDIDPGPKGLARAVGVNVDVEVLS